MKRISLILVLMLICFAIMAQPLSREEALNSANRFIKSHSIEKLDAVISVDDLIFESKSKKEAEYYIFQLPKTGFIIMSGEKATLPVLGYSFENNFNPNDIPLNMKDILFDYAAEINYVRNNNINADQMTIKASERILNNEVYYKNTVYPLLGTIKWYQRPYYNDLCPVYDSYGNRCPVGCVATAMSQIMRYWEYPSSGQGSHSYTSNYGTLSVDFNTTYNWNDMPKAKLGAPNAEIAKFSYQCAVSVNMNFTPNSSGAYQSRVPNALMKYFKYPNTVENRFRASYSADAWHKILLNELDNLRPIQYSGHGDVGGHSFVCDGYNSSGYFHFNWGWGGVSDGYFLTTSLNPSIIGSGDFNSSQLIVIGFAPPTSPGYVIPETPTILNTTHISSNSAILNFTEEKEATSYKIALQKSGGNYEYYTTTNDRFEINNLQASTTYFWKVKALNQYGESDYTPISNFTTLDENIVPEIPTDLSAMLITSNSANLNWSEVEDAISYNISIQVSGGNYEYFTTTSNSFTANNLQPASTYYWTVKAVNQHGESEYASTVNFNTIEDVEEPTDYCTLRANSSYYEWINYFSIGGMYINSSNHNGGYSDFTGKIGTVAQGSRQKVYFKASYKYDIRIEHWSLWIDYDQSKTFERDELVVVGRSKTTRYLYAYINIPIDAKIGETRVRLSMNNSSFNHSCGVFDYGEVEDYTVNIVGEAYSFITSDDLNQIASIPLTNETIEECKLIPNPTNDKFRIDMNVINRPLKAELYNQQGQLLKLITLYDKTTEIDISNFSNGIYFVVIEREKNPITKKIVKN